MVGCLDHVLAEEGPRLTDAYCTVLYCNLCAGYKKYFKLSRKNEVNLKHYIILIEHY